MILSPAVAAAVVVIVVAVPVVVRVAEPSVWKNAMAASAECELSSAASGSRTEERTSASTRTGRTRLTENPIPTASISASDIAGAGQRLGLNHEDGTAQIRQTTCVGGRGPPPPTMQFYAAESFPR